MDDFAIAMDAIPKVVFSRTLTELDWPTARVATKDLEAEVVELKRQEGEAAVVGSPGLIAQLTQAALIDEYQIPSSGAGHKALFGKGMIAGQKVIVAKPMTYMNLSGESVRELVNYYKVDPESELIVVYDDISLAPGQIRIRKKGSAGGHNGIKNIIANLGTDHFMRVKVGVGEKPKNWDLADYVLSPFTKDERPLVNLAIEHAAKAIEQMLNGDVDAAMNEYNRKSANPAE